MDDATIPIIVDAIQDTVTAWGSASDDTGEEAANDSDGAAQIKDCLNRSKLTWIEDIKMCECQDIGKEQCVFNANNRRDYRDNACYGK